MSRRLTARLLSLLPVALIPVALAAPLQLDLLVEQDAVHRVSFEQLAEHGLSPQALATLSLSRDGEPVPVWVDTPVAEQFGPGSSLTFVGQHRRGPHGHYDEHSRHNVYRLSFKGGTPAWGNTLAPQPAKDDAPTATVARHVEEDRVRVRFTQGKVGPGSEVWYWQRLSVLDKKPFELPVDVGAVSAFPGQPLRLRLSFRGWSFTFGKQPVPDHRVEVLWNGQMIGAAEWNGQAEHVLELDPLPHELLRDGSNSLQLRVPMRRSGAKDDVVVDVSLLNWVEIEHAFDGHVETGQLGLNVPQGGVIPLAASERNDVALYSMNGERLEVAPRSRRVAAGFSQASEDLLLLVGAPLSPALIRPDQPSDLRNTAQQADYLMIAHGSLLESARPLAEFHRQRGLKVALIDVQDIYDEFNHGVLSPTAIRDFAAHAYHSWAKPAPKYVLLVGDASWENHGESLDDSNYADWTFQHHETSLGRFVKNSSTAYADKTRSRNLIPTLQVATPEGDSASDSELVAVDGDDWIPDMAIGRLPVADPKDVSSIIAKMIDYQMQAPVGPWRRSFLLIANEDQYMQKFTNAVALGANQHGIMPTKVYPKANSPDNSLYQRQLMDELDEGRLLVHFLGHGGRYIWRTGPPDPRKNHDLFTLDHIDQLTPTSRLPVVLSMTCYSAPFDHPTADSIGEKFLRAENRGAVGVLAASWRNNPTQAFSDALVKHLMRRELSVGEAILEAKRGTKDRILVQTYNYLGDPATRLNLPAGALRASLLGESGKLHVDIDLESMPELRGGRVMVDTFDAQGNRLSTAEHALDGQNILLEAPREGEAMAASVSVYAWHEARRVDAITRLAIPQPESPAGSASD